MHDAAGGADIDQTVQHLPSPAAEAANPFPGGCQGQWDHQNETCETYGYVRSHHDVLHDLVPQEKLIQPNVGYEVKKAVKEGKEAEHSSKADETYPTGNPADRRHSERDHQKPKRPGPGEVSNVGEWIGAEPV